MDPIPEILLLLSEHAATGLDYVSLFMFLNTVAGGHYQERWTEAALQAALTAGIARGWIEPRAAEGETPPSPASAIRPGGPRLHLTSIGHDVLIG